MIVKCLIIIFIVGDSMVFYNGMFFSIFDCDNDCGLFYSCVLVWFGGWWYNDCYRFNFNGEYGNIGGFKGINWYYWKGFIYLMKEVRMLV